SSPSAFTSMKLGPLAVSTPITTPDRFAVSFFPALFSCAPSRAAVTTPPIRATPTSARKMLRVLAIAFPPGVGTSTPSDNVTMRIHFFTQNLQFVRSRRQGGRQRLVDAQFEPGRLPDLLQGDAGVQAADLHAPGVFVVGQDGQVGDDAVRPGGGRQAGCLAGPRAGQVTRRGQEVELLDEAAAVVVGDDEDAPAERAQVVGAAAAGQAHLRAGVVADDGRVEVAVSVDLGAAQEGV